MGSPVNPSTQTSQDSRKLNQVSSQGKIKQPILNHYSRHYHFPRNAT